MADVIYGVMSQWCPLRSHVTLTFAMRTGFCSSRISRKSRYCRLVFPGACRMMRLASTSDFGWSGLRVIDIEGWRKSGYSTSDCGEIGRTAVRIAVCDTKDRGESPTIDFTQSTWRDFVHQVKKSVYAKRRVPRKDP